MNDGSELSKEKKVQEPVENPLSDSCQHLLPRVLGHREGLHTSAAWSNPYTAHLETSCQRITWVSMNKGIFTLSKNPQNKPL